MDNNGTTASAQPAKRPRKARIRTKAEIAAAVAVKAADAAAAAAAAEAAALDVHWGGANIARIIGRSERSVRHLLTRKQLIPGLRKIGGRWCIFPELFHAAVKDAAS
jgi:hypothetical protein